MGGGLTKGRFNGPVEFLYDCLLRVPRSFFTVIRLWKEIHPRLSRLLPHPSSHPVRGVTDVDRVVSVSCRVVRGRSGLVRGRPLKMALGTELWFDLSSVVLGRSIEINVWGGHVELSRAVVGKEVD